MDSRFDLSDIHHSLQETILFAREWFEDKLKIHFDNEKLHCIKYQEYSHPSQRKNRRGIPSRSYICPPFNDVDIVFLAGGTCRIPFVQRWIKEQFPKAEIIIDGELEIITATGAVVHALQLLHEEIGPYVRTITYDIDQIEIKSEDQRVPDQNVISVAKISAAGYTFTLDIAQLGRL